MSEGREEKKEEEERKAGVPRSKLKQAAQNVQPNYFAAWLTAFVK